MNDWRLIETWNVSPALAMGLDEALLASAGAPPTLRVYSWAPEALSLGYFQALADVPAAARVEHVVRRITGGGAIHHHLGELTFSVTIDARHPAYRGTTRESYVRPHRAVIAALNALGVPDATMRGPSAGDASHVRGPGAGSDRTGTGMCFHESTALDVGWPHGGAPDVWAKGVGTAQRRSGGRILHHGSIKLGGSPLEPGVATVESATGRRPSPEVAADALVRAFGLEFDATWTVWTPDEETLQAARNLGQRYASREFLASRRARPRRTVERRASRT